MQKYFVLALIEHDFHISGSKLRSKLVGHFTTYSETVTRSSSKALGIYLIVEYRLVAAL